MNENLESRRGRLSKLNPMRPAVAPDHPRLDPEVIRTQAFRFQTEEEEEAQRLATQRRKHAEIKRLVDALLAWGTDPTEFATARENADDDQDALIKTYKVVLGRCQEIYQEHAGTRPATTKPPKKIRRSVGKGNR